MESSVYYFCYGSNMLTKRMHVNNKSATTFANGVLQNYKLSFSGQSVIWNGATANIIPEPNCFVIGVVYTLNPKDIPSLDKQEFGYDAIEVEVELVKKPGEPKETVICRTYTQKENYKSVGGQIPSKLYKNVILKGAREHNLPISYQNSIEEFHDNGITNCGPEGFVL